MGKGALHQQLIATYRRQSLAFVAHSETSGATSLTLPTGAAVGDLILVYSMIANSDSSALPSDPSPTINGVGLTAGSANTGTPGGAYGVRSKFYRKVLDAGDISAGQVVSLGSDNSYRHIIVLLRPTLPITTVTEIDNSATITGGDPSARSTSNVASQTIPVFVFGFYGTNGSFSSARTFTPTEDGTLSMSGGGAAANSAKYKIYNVSPADVTIDWGDDGDRNVLHVNAISVS